ncbi:MAG: mechanosensitive ion channel family protein [Elusimicrobia bacterium]|nr:mechanosensitive ion channel family protein [Elusimicrobiota bacterium]
MDRIRTWFDYGLVMGNTPVAYLYAAAAFAAALALLYLVKNVVVARLRAMAEKTATDLDDLAVDLLDKFKWPDYQLLAFYIATRYLERSAAFDKALLVVLLLVFTYRAITMAQALITYWLHKIAAQRQLSDAAKASVVNSTQVIMRTLVWVAAALFVLDNMGVNISSVLAGLGIGGVAVALASQAILGDLFNFFVILLDKPFTVGDFIITDTAVCGTVEKLGLKSVHIRNLSGEILVVSNSKLLAMEVKNYQHMQRRRVVIKTSVVYRTPLEKLKRVPAMIKEAVEAIGDTTFDRCNLSALGSFSVDFETVYYLEKPDYALHMAVQEKLLQSVIERFGREGIEFAYPTQTLYVQK